MIRRSGAVAFAVSLVLAVALPAAGASAPPAVGPRGMVVAPEPLAAEIGLEVLRRGGRAADAAVAAAFALAVTYPRAGALGGGGFALVRQADGETFALDFREAAPARLTAGDFLDDDGNPIAGRSLETGLAVGVPGLVRGLAELHARFGSRPWGELVAPAIRLAEGGFPLGPANARALDSARARVSRNPSGRAIFFRDGRPLAEGERLVQADLAETLRGISKGGADGFYRGRVAAEIVRAVREAGGSIDEEDLAGYRAVFREPLVGTYRGHRIVTFPPPSSGGIALLQILALLEPHDLARSGPFGSRTIHLLAEAERRAFADRSRWLGDPDFVRVPVRGLLDPGYLAERGAGILPDRATPSERLGPGRPPREPGETLHFSVADARGRALAVTITLNSWFGSGIVADGTGVLLNNQIDDFALAPGVPNQFGLLGGEANAVRGGKRPLSSMTPTIVEFPGPPTRPRLVLGSPGGPTIITTVAQIVTRVLDHGMSLSEAVDAPRFHHPWKPDRIEHEPRAFPEDVAAALASRGHALHARDPIGNAAVLGWDRDGGRWLGAADPRGDGAARGY